MSIYIIVSGVEYRDSSRPWFLILIRLRSQNLIRVVPQLHTSLSPSIEMRLRINRPTNAPLLPNRPNLPERGVEWRLTSGIISAPVGVDVIRATVHGDIGLWLRIRRSGVICPK